MRALVDMSELQVEALDVMAKETRQSRAALIRAAIDDYLERHHRTQVEDGFGLWGVGRLDGLACQREVRDAW